MILTREEISLTSFQFLHSVLDEICDLNGERERERVEKEMGGEKGSLVVLYKAYLTFYRQVIRLNLTVEQVAYKMMCRLIHA